MAGQTTHRRAFTLLELLVVVAVVAILTAIFLPAIEQSRAQARRARCKNNLKQYALAMHNYHETYRTLPPGWVTKDRTFDRTRGFQWQASILPFADQAPLYNRFNFEKEPPEPNKLTQTRIEIYRCPADTTPNTNKVRGNYGTSNYSAVFGRKSLPRWLPDTMSEFWPGRVPTPKTSDGMFWANSSCRFRDVTDGLSNTFLIGERSVNSAAAIWIAVTANNHENDAVTDCSHASRINHGLGSFSSRHAGGANFAMGDGSVRFVSENIESRAPVRKGDEPGLYQKLGSRNDGFPIGEF